MTTYLSMPVNARAERLNWRILRKRVKTAYHSYLRNHPEVFSKARAVQTTAEGREGQLSTFDAGKLHAPCCPAPQDVTAHYIPFPRFEDFGGGGFTCLDQTGTAAALGAILPHLKRTFFACLTFWRSLRQTARRFANAASDGRTHNRPSTGL